MISPGQISSVLALLTRAGNEIMKVYASDNFGIRFKEDESPVTKADYASDTIIKNGLSVITPGIPVYSEETRDVPYSVRSEWKDLWILDPLDGTKEFIARSDEFCISLALITEGRAVAGFIQAPVTGEIWFAQKDEGAWKVANGNRVRLPLAKGEGPFSINISRTHHSKNEEEWIVRFMQDNEAVTHITGSAIKFSRIAEGSSDLYPKFSLIHEWDIAAGQIIIEEAGGRIIEPATGKPPVFNKEDYHQPPFVAFGPRVKDWTRWAGKM
ncbi:MAG TPA: 3'(2'),5'-bisphosphate nucleotidase CysQ [Bacteroidales bacterium]|nr:3'(2'),5'-bisphosphate nucleotidase CysQ [Bacteroidales bacterium]